jgi:uncharacterized protein (TIGR02996 family)
MAVRPEIAAFLRDVKDHPDDDTPRLILADWLQDQDDPLERDRGEFIRAQCLRMRLDESHPEHVGFLARERQLLDRHAAEWLGPLFEGPIPYRFQRGLLRLVADPDAVAGEAVEPLGSHDVRDWVEIVQLRGRNVGLLAGVAVWFRWAGLPGLDLRGHDLSGAGLRSLFATGPLDSLRQLDLSCCHIGQEGSAALAAARLSFLTALRLEDNFLRPAGLQALFAATYWPNLTTLNLRWNDFEDAGGAVLAAAPGLPRLTTLYLGHNHISVRGATALLSSSSLPALRTLYLEHNSISEAAADDLRRRFGERVRF